jgi:hypothetical protein
LAILSANNPDFTSQITLKAFSKLLGINRISLSSAIKHLEAMGFIQSPTLHAYPSFGEKSMQSWGHVGKSES